MRVNDFVTETFQASIRTLVEKSDSARNPKDVEALHDFRVGLRKLRSHLRSFESTLGTKWVRLQRDRLEWLDSYVRPVRDVDVLILRLNNDVKQLGMEIDSEVIKSLHLSLAIASQRERARLKIAMDSQLFSELMQELGSWTVDSIAFRKEPRILENWLKELGRASRKEIFTIALNLNEQSPDRELHKLRIKSKRARYLAEASIPVLGQKAKRRAKEYESIQNFLGEYHDSYVMSQWLSNLANSQSEFQPTTSALRGWEDRHRTELRVRWHALWSEIESGTAESSESRE